MSKNKEIESLFEGVKSDLLTEDVKQKIEILIESKVQDRISTKIEELDSEAKQYQDELNESSVEETSTYIKENVVNVLDEYLDITANEYIKENKLAIEDGLKAEMFDNLVRGISGVLNENSIHIDSAHKDDKKVTEVFAENRALKSQLNDALNESIEEKQKYLAEKAWHVVELESQNLNSAESQRLVKLCEDIDVTENSFEDFKNKVSSIKEMITENVIKVPGGSSDTNSLKDQISLLEADNKKLQKQFLAESAWHTVELASQGMTVPQSKKLVKLCEDVDVTIDSLSEFKNKVDSFKTMITENKESHNSLNENLYVDPDGDTDELMESQDFSDTENEDGFNATDNKIFGGMGEYL